VNAEAGVLVTIAPGRLALRLDSGRDVQLPARYVRDGHLDHGYAITAHRAQGATVDRAFVLGSDELSREWGYTALSRHRIEARFYVSATPTFLNETPAPLQAGADVTSKVALMLAQSRAKHLATTHTRRPEPGTRDQHEQGLWRRAPEQPALCRARDPLAGIDRDRGIGLEL
jgi:ATP-dependent exoDNAse (exonuclease V) alpha subunit